MEPKKIKLGGELLIKLGGELSKEIKFLLIQNNHTSYAVGGFRTREALVNHLKYRGMSGSDLYIYEVNPIKITVETTFG